MKNKLKEEYLTEKQRKIAAAVAFTAFLIFCGAVGWAVGKPMIKFVSEPEKFRVWVNSHGIFAEIAFVLMMVFQVVIAFVPGEPLEIGAGYAFGAIEGTLLCEAGIALGSVLVFVLVRKFGIRLVEIFFSREKIMSLKFMRDKKRRNAITFIVFFLPGTPKDLLTYFVGLTDIKLSHFILLTTVARLPSVITSILCGDALGVAQYKQAIVVFGITFALSALGWIIYKIIITVSHRNEKPQDKP